MKLNQEYWENRYKTRSTGWDLGKISNPLKEVINNIIDKSTAILIPGAGNGYEAEYLLEQGFSNVTVIDIAKTPLENLRNRIPHLEHIKFYCEDYFEHQGCYDIILEQTFFCALPPELRTRYVQKTYDLLSRNGRLTGVLFNFDNSRSEPPYGGNVTLYRDLFNPLFSISKMVECSNSELSRVGKEILIDLKKNNEK